MTVCIGALAAKSKAIVMVADKAITYTSHSSALLQWDVTGLCKILPIGASSWHVLIGGDPIFALQVIHACEASLLDKPRRGWQRLEHDGLRGGGICFRKAEAC